MRAMVTGGAGFIGSHLVDALLEAKWNVSCFVRPTSDLRWLQGKPVTIVKSDLRAALEGATHVFHAAGETRAPTEREYLESNAALTSSVLDACAGRPIQRFVLVSSLGASGPSLNGTPRTEEMVCRPASPYGRSKLAAEIEAKRRIGDRLTIVRPPFVYGPRDRNMLGVFGFGAAGVLPMIGSRRYYSLIHVRDLAEGILKTLQGPPDTWFLSNEEHVASDTLAAMIAEAVGRKPFIRVHIPALAIMGGADLMELMGGGRIFDRGKAAALLRSGLICSATKAREKLGWTPRIPLREGLRETAQWYLDQGWLERGGA
jgi:dihydroflavonol-4-reductase